MHKNYRSVVLGIAALAVVLLGVLYYLNSVRNAQLKAKENAAKASADAKKLSSAQLAKKVGGYYYYNPALNFELTVPLDFKAAITPDGVKFGSKIDGYNAKNDRSESYGIFYTTKTLKPVMDTAGLIAGKPEKVVLNGPTAIKRTYESAAADASQSRITTLTMNINGVYYIFELEAAKSNTSAWENFDKTIKSFKFVFKH